MQNKVLVTKLQSKRSEAKGRKEAKEAKMKKRSPDPKKEERSGKIQSQSQKKELKRSNHVEGAQNLKQFIMKFLINLIEVQKN